MMKKITLAAVLMALLTNGMKAQGDGGLQIKARAGWSIGATAPLGMPEAFRSLDSYKLTPSFLIGADARMPMGGKWGVLVGLRFENKAMNADVTTKAYHMVVRKGDSELEGLFTGKVHQEVKEWMLTLPIQATFSFSDKLQLKAGPYFSLLTSKDFSGIASDGYLRQTDPTGPKILMGDKDGEWATYDFSSEMRNFQVGLGVGLDWQFYKNLGASVDLNWGLNGIFNSDFKTVDQTLFPIYGTIGVFYRLR